ncbi:amino acid ABC transporter permease [Kineosporia succinea]|uniref:Glutamate transport system permease protein n=1 Tax=Kineosporia succinea TaxID=84632 RepID=A0ABT9NW35_9ACTN|nr:amino acid ABC transporter permease [Kineosporia succinea]MDP9824628.1 glutamate transport system permease protein [Kineosporia succinea]
MSTPNLSVLYDAPGPKARRRALIGSGVVAVVLLAVLYVVYVRLADQGQFDRDRWAPLFDPSDDLFQPVWENIWSGFQKTMTAAVLAIVLSMVIGTAFGVARVMSRPAPRIPLVVVIETLRGLPVIVLIYMAYQLLPDLGVNYDPLPGENALWYVVVGLTAYNSVVIAEILRSGVASLPRGQREAGLVIGLTPLQTMVQIQLPQAFRTMLPALISQMVVILKDTSLVTFIGGYDELLNTAKRIFQTANNPLQTLLLIGLIFIVINFALSQLAVFAEKRMSRRSAGRGVNTLHVDPGTT